MSIAHVDFMDRSVEKAHIWLNDLAEELGTEDRQHAYRCPRRTSWCSPAFPWLSRARTSSGRGIHAAHKHG